MARTGSPFGSHGSLARRFIKLMPVRIKAMIHMIVNHGYDSSHDFNTPQDIMVMI